MKIKDVEYNDYVYCTEVPLHNTLLVRRYGKVCWSGNCRSTTIPIIDYEKFGELDEKDFEEKNIDNSSENGIIKEKKIIPLSEEELKYRDPYKTFLKENEYIDWKNSLEIDEKNAIGSYTGSRYELFNGFLRGNIKEIDDNSLKEIEKLKTALSKYEVKETFTSYRGNYARYGIEKQKVGDIFVLDKGFISSTMAESITDEFAADNGSVIYRIRVPAGKKVGAYVDEFSTFKGEEEFLFLPNTKFKILKIDSKEISNGTQWVYDLEVF